MGTVVTAEQVRRCADAGARFVVSPGLVPEVLEAARQLGVGALPGVLTPTEVLRATALGAIAVKLFPASLGGPDYIRTLRGPFPDVDFWPTGGIRIVPLTKPAIAAVALFQFLYSWNDFFAPLLYVGENPTLWTLAVGLAEFRGQFAVQWNLTMAASVLFILPVIVLFFLAQRVFIEGVTLTGVKG